METKSRYEVISDLENKKRELIQQKNSLNIELEAKKHKLKQVERQKSDTVVVMDRQIEDLKDEIKLDNDTMNDQKATIEELIKSTEDSLERLGGMMKK